MDDVAGLKRLLARFPVDENVFEECTLLDIAALRPFTSKCIPVLERVGCKHSLWYAIREDNPHLVDELFPPVGVLSKEKIQELGATANAVGNVHALRRLLELGLGDGYDPSRRLWLDREKSELSVSFYGQIPLLYFSAYEGHDKASRLLMETFGEKTVLRPGPSAKQLIRSCIEDLTVEKCRAYSRPDPRECAACGRWHPYLPTSLRGLLICLT